MKIRLLTIALLLVAIGTKAQPRTYTDIEAQTAWASLQRQPLTEATFRQSCDLIQDVGQTNIVLSFGLLTDYVPKVQRAGNWRWTHVLLVNWGKGYKLRNQYAEADSLFRLARYVAGPANPKAFCDALLFSIELDTDWNKPDSLNHYFVVGEQIARQTRDFETLSFLRSYRAMANLSYPERARHDFEEAIRLAAGLPDKNALLIARYDRAIFILTTPQQQVASLDSLLTLIEHPTLAHKPRFYERTVYFGRPRLMVLYSLMQVNLLLTDTDNAGRFADMIYDEIIRPKPSQLLAPYMGAELSFVRSEQGQLSQARTLLDSSQRQFGGVEAAISYPAYFIAAGRLAEKNGQFGKAVSYYQEALTKGPTTQTSSRIPPELLYIGALLRTDQRDKAGRLLATFGRGMTANHYTAIGLYYYQILASLYKAQGDHTHYVRALATYHTIRDSLTGLNQYRAVQQVITRVRIRDKEQQISRLNAEKITRAQQLRRERWLYGIGLALALLAVGLLALLLRNRQIRARQREALQQSQSEKLEKQRQIELMQNVMQAEDNERLSIADQLHNEVNPMLAVVLLNVSSALETTPADAPTGPKLRNAQAVLTSVSGTVRGISHRLTPRLIEQQGFKRAIEDLAESVNLSEKVSIQTIVVGFEKTLPIPFLSDLYRIVQELVQNVIRHAQATEATIEVIEHDRHVTIMVEDNGVGITPDAAGDGQGLQTIRAKVALRHGQMDVQRKPEGGTLVVIDNLQQPQFS